MFKAGTVPTATAVNRTTHVRQDCAKPRPSRARRPALPAYVMYPTANTQCFKKKSIKILEKWQNPENITKRTGCGPVVEQSHTQQSPGTHCRIHVACFNTRYTRNIQPEIEIESSSSSSSSLDHRIQMTNNRSTCSHNLAWQRS